jgi:ankyrin repeat protein
VEKRHPEGEFGRVAEALIAAGSPWDALQYPTGDARIDEALRPRLHLRVDGAALLGDEESLDRLLGADPAPDQAGLALLGAAKGGHAALCRRLLQQGADIAARNAHGSTALHMAVGSADRGVIELLLDSGADAFIETPNEYGYTPLRAAREKGREDIVQLLVARRA